MPRTHRLAELDLVRTALVFAVVVFHGLRVFDPFDFYVKGPQVDALAPVILLGGLVGMPLFFVLAGVSLWHSMGRRAPTALARERLRRLGIPFVVAVVVLVPAQIHAQRMQAGTAGTYWDTLRDFFDVRVTGHFPIPVDGRAGGPFEPAHVWFLALGPHRRAARLHRPPDGRRAVRLRRPARGRAGRRRRGRDRRDDDRRVGADRRGASPHAAARRLRHGADEGHRPERRPSPDQGRRRGDAGRLATSLGNSRR